jgi:hypothetical protein
MTERDKIKKVLRKEMKKATSIMKDIGNDSMKRLSFSFCYAQAKFDTLMDIDHELELGAFYRKEKK